MSQQPPEEEIQLRTWSSASSSSKQQQHRYNYYDESAAKDVAQAKQQPSKVRMLFTRSAPKKKALRSDRIMDTNKNNNHNKNSHNQIKRSRNSSNNQKRLNQYHKSKKYQFQRLTSGVSVKTVDLTLRTAFEERALLHLLLTGINTTSNANAIPTAVSPSPLHVQVLNHFYVKMKEARQLCWHPSVSMDADPFIRHNGKSSLGKNNGYRGISDQEYKMGTIDLMSTSPALTYYKKRLPMRADVGFPDVSQEEILIKQEEIRIETEWEEFSPRLIQLLHTPLLHSSPTFSTQEYQWISTCPSKHPLYPYATPTLNQYLSPTTAINTNSSSIPSPKQITALSTVKEEEDDGSSNNIQTSSSSVSTAQAGNTTKAKTKTKIISPLETDRTWSVFAPPVDATYSSKYMWRARPFADRPAGMTHVLVTPTLEQEDVVCSFALYYFNDKKLIKVSEDCNIASTISHSKNMNALKAQFPNWNGTISQQQQKKAILSYDPILTPTKDLYLLFQVYQITQPPPPKTKKAFRWSSSTSKATSTPITKSNAMYETFGTQYLSPLCFSYIPLYSSGGNIPHYPKESCEQTLTFLPYPSSNVDLAQHCSALLQKHNSIKITAKSSNSKKKSKLRISTSKQSALTTVTEDDNVSTTLSSSYGGYATVITSSLGIDFTQSLLHDASSSAGNGGLRSLTDPSGDCAIAIHPDNNKNNTVKKRSQLIRLPPVAPCGYLESAEIIEVLTLPHPEWTLSSYTLVNFLYLYPKKLALMDRDVSNSKSLFTVRIRLVQQSMEVDESTGAMETVYTPMEAIYNPAPGSPALLTAIYTKIPFQVEEEVKIRLPLRLDGSYFFQFTLYTLEFDEKEHLLHPTIINETLVPLSTTTRSSNKVMTIIPNGLHRIKLLDNVIFQIETKLASSIHVSDTSVATVLRDFPFTPSNSKGKDELRLTKKFSTLLLEASCEAIVHHFCSLININMYKLLQLSADNFENKIPFFLQADKYSLLSDANNDHVEKSTTLLEGMQCIFAILNQTKKQFLEKTVNTEASEDENINRLHRFLKQYMDVFDEQTLCPSFSKHNITTNKSEDKSENESSVNSRIVEDYESDDPEVDPDLESFSELALEKLVDKLIENATLISVQQEVYGRSQSNHRTKSITRNNTPFVRKAYGASKIDRMRAEAERLAQQKFTELFDDDETVATASTWQSHSKWTVASPDNFHRQRTFDDYPLSPGGSTFVTTVSMRKSSNDVINTPFERAKSMAKHVNNLVIGPCVASSLQPGIFPSNKSISKESLSKQKKLDNAKSIEDNNKHTILNPGSDVEEENNIKFKSKRDVLSHDFIPYPNAPDNMRLRGHLPAYLDKLYFTINETSHSSIKRTSTKKDQSIESSSPYLYEIILTLWFFVYQHPDHRKTILPQFVQHLDFILPICLKSFVLRCSAIRSELEIIPSMVLDGKHIHILHHLSKVIAQDLFALASHSNNDNQSKSDKALLNALTLSDAYLDFIIGMFSIIHPSQVAHLVQVYFETLETYMDDNNTRYIRCSCQLRIRAIEKLAVMPRFIALNFPPKYASYFKRSHDETLSSNENAFQFMASDRLPETHWLATLLGNNCLSICSTCSEAIHVSNVKPTGQSSEQNLALSQEDKIRLQSTALHAITCVYELVLRRHAIDDRHQTEEARGRIAGMLLQSILNHSVESVSWLTELDMNHKIRTTWLLSLLYLIQEAPETALREAVFKMSQNQAHKGTNPIQSLLQLLKLAGLTFQSFIYLEETKSSMKNDKFSSWLIQESFNTICAGVILIVDECTHIDEKNNLASAVLDLSLFIISTPQSSVTLLRCLGGASHALEKFGTVTFLDSVGDQLQNWARIIFTLMNSTALSVRSMAVDLTVSLFGGAFEEDGNIDYIALVFLTLLPEIVAREIAMYSASGCISSVECVESVLWPLRRALADVEDANPLDDDRVDPQLAPFLSSLCRACQAIIDGVLIELRLRGRYCEIVGVQVDMLSDEHVDTIPETPQVSLSWRFDADEESLYEAANFFQSETGPMQRIRWLLTLKSLHELKAQWIEAAETLTLCAKTIADAIPHIKNVWRPSRFPLWYDQRCAPWLTMIGRKKVFEKKNATNSQVIDFADEFLEPRNIRTFTGKSNKEGPLVQPSVAVLCKMLAAMAKEALVKYDIETGIEKLIFSRLEGLLRKVMSFLDQKSVTLENRSQRQRLKSSGPNWARLAEDIAALRKMSATINELVTKVSERLLLLTEADSTINGRYSNKIQRGGEKYLNLQNIDIHMKAKNQYYVRLLLLGKKPRRFEESTTIPTFLEWENPVICRVPKETVLQAFESTRLLLKDKSNANKHSEAIFEDALCDAVAKSYIAALNEDTQATKTVLCHEAPSVDKLTKESETTFLIVTLVHMKESFFPNSATHSCVDGECNASDVFESKCFVHGKKVANGDTHSIPKWTEMTVAKKFPSCLSRQKTLITSEFITRSTEIVEC